MISRVSLLTPERFLPQQPGGPWAARSSGVYSGLIPLFYSYASRLEKERSVLGEAMGTFPPMSNSKLVEEAGTSAVDAFNTVQERLSQDELTAEQEEETKAALEEILAIFQIVQKQKQER